MARAKKKEKELTIEEKLERALVPVKEQPYQIPENWCWVKFESLIEDIADGPFGSNLKTEHYTLEKEARIIQLSNIGEEGWRDDNKKYTTFKHAMEIERSIVKPGSIVIAKMMPAGRAIICPNNEKMYILSSDAVRVVLHSFLNVKYCVYAINSSFFRTQVQENTQGITRARTSIKKLKNCFFVLPPLLEQQRIVNRIERLFVKLDEAKEKVQAVVDGFEDRKTAILHKAFTGELTKEWRKIKNIEIDSWKRLTLNDIAEYKKGPFGSSITKAMFVPKGKKTYKVYEQGNAIKKTLDYGHYYISEEKYEQLKGFAVRSGDIIISCAGTIGEVFILPENCEEGVINQALMRVRLFDIIDEQFFLYYFGEILKGDVNDQANGTAIKNIPPFKIMKAMAILLPTIEEQKKIVSIVDGILAKESQAKTNAEQLMYKIDTIKESILAQAFCGKLYTNDPNDENIVELMKRVL